MAGAHLPPDIGSDVGAHGDRLDRLERRRPREDAPTVASLNGRGATYYDETDVVVGSGPGTMQLAKTIVPEGTGGLWLVTVGAFIPDDFGARGRLIAEAFFSDHASGKRSDVVAMSNYTAPGGESPEPNVTATAVAAICIGQAFVSVIFQPEGDPDTWSDVRLTISAEAIRLL